MPLQVTGLFLSYQVTLDMQVLMKIPAFPAYLANMQSLADLALEDVLVGEPRARGRVGRGWGGEGHHQCAGMALLLARWAWSAKDTWLESRGWQDRQPASCSG
jgi:hypothetical protein